MTRKLCWQCIFLFPILVNDRTQVALHHGDPKVAQLRVEEWLAAVPPPYPLQSSQIAGLTNGERSSGKDWYGKVLELYCLSILPRNEEWDFATTFIGMNEYLSQSKKQVPLPPNFEFPKLTIKVLPHKTIGPKIGP